MKNDSVYASSANQHQLGLLLPSIICLAACFFYLYEFVLQVSPNVMAFQLMADLKIDAAQLGIMSGSYYIAYTLMQIPAGVLYDRMGPRTLLTFATLICAAGAFAFGLTSDMFTASAGRFLMGIGSAFAFIGCLVLVSRWFPPQYFAFLAGIVQFMSSVGALLGEMPLAAAVSAYGWRETINTIGVVGILGAIMIWLIVRDSPSSVRTAHGGHQHKSILKQLMQVCQHTQTWVIGLFAFTSWAPIIVFGALWGVPFLSMLYGINETQAAGAVSMVWLAIGIGSPIVGWWSDKIQRRNLPLTICMLIGLIAICIVLFVPNLPFYAMYPLLFLFGFAASTQTLSFGVVKDNTPPRVLGTAIGFNNMAVVCGGIIFQPLVGYLLHASWNGTTHNGIPLYDINSYRLALIILPACFVLGLILSIFVLKETYCKHTYE